MRDEIRFVLNGKIQRVAGCAGDLTLLQWLREQAHLRGTKEGAPRGIAVPVRLQWRANTVVASLNIGRLMRVFYFLA